MPCSCTYALAAIGRAGAMRANCASMLVLVELGGADVTTLTRKRDAEITDELDEIANTANFRYVGGTAPALGQAVRITLGTRNTLDPLFAGRILSRSQVYESVRQNVAFDCSCIDNTWLLDSLLVSDRWLSTSITAIIEDLITDWTTGAVSTARVAADLPVLEEFTCTHEKVHEALTRLARLCGAYWYLDYNGVLHFFTGTETGVTHPADITDGSLIAGRISGLEVRADYSQTRTRVYYEGGGSSTPIAIAAGATEIPVEDPSWYSGGRLTAGWQRLTYTGVADPAGAGALVGPGTGPSSALDVYRANDANATNSLIAGASYQYAVTYVTASGETLPGPRLTFVCAGGQATPLPAPTLRAGPAIGGGRLTPGATYKFRWQARYWLGAYPTSGLAYSAEKVWVQPAGYTRAEMYIDPAWFLDKSLQQVVALRTGAGGANLYEELPFASPGYGGWYETANWTDGDLAAGATGGAIASLANVTDFGGARVTQIPTGPAGVTARKVYRTAANGSQLKLLGTISNNTDTSFFDVGLPDGSLGANAPSSDTSGLTPATTGEVLAGSTSMLLSSTAPFRAEGGYARIGGMVIRYTGLNATAGTLTGIPASGDGALTATVRYGAEVIALGLLTGIPASGEGAITATIPASESINVLAMVEDLEAQAALAAILGAPHDGVIEEWLQDQRLSLVEATERAEAFLELHSTAEVRLRYSTRDRNSKAGRDVTVALGAPTNISGTFRLQRVQISELEAAYQDSVPPRYLVEASDRRYSLEDLLRRIKGEAGADAN